MIGDDDDLRADEEARRADRRRGAHFARAERLGEQCKQCKSRDVVVDSARWLICLNPTCGTEYPLAKEDGA